MTKVILLKELKKFTEVVTRDLILPVRPTEEEPEPPPRPPFVYRMRLPKFRDATRKAPYILHQVLTGKDIQAAGKPLDSSALVRTVFCVYHQDEEEGALSLLNLMEELRIALLERPVLCQRGSTTGPFALDLKAGLEALAYPDDREPRSAPFYLGEMISTWRIEPVRRLDADQIIHGVPRWDPAERSQWGEEEQGSGRRPRRKAGAELSGLCDDDGAPPWDPNAQHFKEIFSGKGDHSDDKEDA